MRPNVMNIEFHKIKIIPSVLSVICFFVPFFFAYATAGNDITINELKLESAEYKNSDIVRGNFLIQNNSEGGSDLSYEITLIQDGKIFDRVTFQVKEQVQPEKNIIQEIEYGLPVNIRTGEYVLKIQLYSEDGFALNWEEKEISIEGNNFFVNVTNSYILKDGEALDVKEIPEYYPEDVPEIEADVYNPNDISVVLVPRITLWRIDPSKTESDQFFGSEVELLSRKNDKFRVDMPKLGQQGVYAAEMEFLYQGENISSIESFSWKIINKDAKISNIETKDGLYYPGKENKLIIGIEGSVPAGETRNAQLTIELKDRTFQTLETQSRPIEIRSGNFEVEVVSSVPVDDNSLNVRAVIKADDKIIDAYEGKLAVKIERKIIGEKESKLAGMIAAIFVIFIVIAYIVAKNFNKIRDAAVKKLNN